MRGTAWRRRVLLGGLGLLLVPVGAGCGAGDPSGESTDSGSASGGSGDQARAQRIETMAGKTWLLRTESYAGADGETRIATYVSLDPATGKSQVVTMPPVLPAEASGPASVLLVDAGHEWALADTRPSKAERAGGTVTLTRLADGGRVSLPLRTITKTTGLVPDHVAFDATKPGQMRVVSGRSVWLVDVTARTATPQAEVPISDSWLFGGFALDTGEPFVAAIDSFETRPPGNGETDKKVVTRDGGTVVVSDAGLMPGQPKDDDCEQTTGFVSKDDDVWEFCAAKTSLTVKTREGTRWTPVSKATVSLSKTAAASGGTPGDLVWVLPPVA